MKEHISPTLIICEGLIIKINNIAQFISKTGRNSVGKIKNKKMKSEMFQVVVIQPITSSGYWFFQV